MVDFILHVTASGERTDETLAELARRLDRGPLAPDAHGRVRIWLTEQRPRRTTWSPPAWDDIDPQWEGYLHIHWPG